MPKQVPWDFCYEVKYWVPYCPKTVAKPAHLPLIFPCTSRRLHYISSHPFSQDKGLGKQNGGRDQGEKKSFPFGMEIGEKEECKLMLTSISHYYWAGGAARGRTCLACSRPWPLSPGLQDIAWKATASHLQVSATPTYKDRALAGLVLLFYSFACIPLFGIYICLAPFWPDRELSLLLFNWTQRHTAAKRVKT